MGYHRDTFYEVKRAFQTGGVAALVEQKRGPKGPHPNRVPEEVEDKILDYALDFPTHGAQRVANQLRLQDIEVSPAGVRGSGYDTTSRRATGDSCGVRFGGRQEETESAKADHRASCRPYISPTTIVTPDLLFEVVSRRYGQKPILLTTNKPFSEWNEVFPKATCVVTLVDRLTDHAEIVKIEGDSYRRKEADEEALQRARQRAKRRKQTKAKR